MTRPSPDATSAMLLTTAATLVDDGVATVERGLGVEGNELGLAAGQRVATLALARLDCAQKAAPEVVEALALAVDVGGAAGGAGEKGLDAGALTVEALLHVANGEDDGALEPARRRWYMSGTTSSAAAEGVGARRSAT